MTTSRNITAGPRRLIVRLGVLLGLLAAALATTMGAAGAAPSAPVAATAPAAASVGDYSGAANANLIHIAALQGLPGLGTLADLQVIPADATVDSTKTPQSVADAKNVAVKVLTAGLNLQEASQTAAPDNAQGVTKSFLDLNVAPLASLSVAKGTAHARWLGADACVPVGTPISEAKSEVANLKILPGLLLGNSLLSLDNQAGGTLYTDSTVGLTNVAGQSTQGVKSEATTQLTGINLAGQLTLNVIAPLDLTAVAGGTPGSAKIEATQPVIQILDSTGKVVFTLDATHTSFALPNNPLITLSLGTITNKQVAADGTSASADGSLLTINVGALGGITLAHVALGEAHAAATVPTGGVRCPGPPPPPPNPQNPLREVHKTVSAAQVAPGGTFLYTITVPNRGDHEIDDLKVTDHISGPAGSTVIATTPKATSVSGLDVSWSDPNPLQPNETRNYTITVQVPDNAPNGATYTDTATASGTYQGQPVSQTVTLPNIPTVTTAPFTGCHLNESNKATDHLTVTPGETFVYYVNVLNDGDQLCTGVTVTDTLDSQVSFVSCTFGCTNSGQNVSWTVPDLGTGSSLTLAVTVKVGDTAKGTLANTAVIHQPGQPDIPVSVTGPTIGGTSTLAPPNPPSFGTPPGGVGGEHNTNPPGANTGPTKPLAYTGWSTPGWILLGLLAAVALSLGLTRRARRTTP